jgi:uncharacterized YkwD family protein
MNIEVESMKYNPYVLTALAQLIEIAASPSINTLADQRSKMLMLINSERAKLGIQPLRISNALNKVAAAKSQDMVEKDYFSHQSPTYGSPFDMLRSYGINYNCAGENLSIDKCADDAHTALLHSKVHRDNILNPNFIEIGIGIHAKRNASFAYTQLFIG